MTKLVKTARKWMKWLSEVKEAIITTAAIGSGVAWCYHWALTHPISDKQVCQWQQWLIGSGLAGLGMAFLIYYIRIRRKLRAVEAELAVSLKKSPVHHWQDDYTHAVALGLYRRKDNALSGYLCGQCLPPKPGELPREVPVRQTGDTYDCLVCGYHKEYRPPDWKPPATT